MGGISADVSVISGCTLDEVYLAGVGIHHQFIMQVPSLARCEVFT